MEVRFQSGNEMPVESKVSLRRGHLSVGIGDEGSFAATDGLERALSAAPDVRADAVAQAEKVIALPHYPPPELIHRIARLLGAEWPSASE